MIDRYPIPATFDANPDRLAIDARLEQVFSDRPIRIVRVVYWRDGLDMPLRTLAFPSHQPETVWHSIPAGATHLTIEA